MVASFSAVRAQSLLYSPSMSRSSLQIRRSVHGCSLQSVLRPRCSPHPPSSNILRPLRSMHSKSGQSTGSLRLPPGTWDSHMHVMGDVSKYAIDKKAQYKPDVHSLDDALAFERTVGIHNVVLVQPSIYGNDNSCQLDALRGMGPERGRAVIQFDPDDTSRETLQKWHALGVRGVRINLKSVSADLDDSIITRIKKTSQAIKEFDWVLQIFTGMETIPLIEELIPSLGVKVCLDHFGCPSFLPADNPSNFNPNKHLSGFPSFSRLLKTGKVWVKFSAGYRLVKDPKSPELEVLAKEILRLRSDRVVFATDWPHTRFDGLDIIPWIEDVLGYCRDEGGEELVRKVCVDNNKVLWDIQ